MNGEPSNDAVEGSALFGSLWRAGIDTSLRVNRNAQAESVGGCTLTVCKGASVGISINLWYSLISCSVH